MARVRVPGGTLPGAQDARTVRRAARLVAVVLLLLGAAGFVPGVTTDVGELALGGRNSGAALFGVFAVSAAANALHLAMGVLGLFSSRTNNAASLFLVLGGIALGVLGVYGGLVGADSPLNLFAFDGASRWAHVVLGIFMIVIGVALSPRARRPVAPAGAPADGPAPRSRRSAGG